MTFYEFIKENLIASLIGLVIFFLFLFFPILLIILPAIGYIYSQITETKPRYPTFDNFDVKSFPKNHHTNEISNYKPIRGNRLMSSAERNAYLASPSWQSLRQQVITRDKVCQLTGSSQNLEVHHITYDNLGAEYLEDLVLLSRKAHQFVHDYYGSYDRTNTYPIEPLKNNLILLNIS